MELRVRVTARASRDELAGLRDGVLHVRVTAPPVDGKANQAVCRLIARAVGVGRTSVTVIRGERARDKVVRIEGVEPASVAETMARRVYSTDDGDLRKARPQQKRDHAAAGNRVKVRRETAGRKGKGVTTITGVPVSDDELKALAGKLKKRCGVGGSTKGGVIELQGDHRDAVVEVLEQEGYDVVLAGG